MLGEAEGVESVEEAGEGESQPRDCGTGTWSAGRWASEEGKGGEFERCAGNEDAVEVGETGETTGGAA